MDEREKIIETLRASGYGYFVTHEKANADEALNDAADALIAAGYGDVKEVKRKAFVYSREIAHLDNKLKETEHRAEVAERACRIATDKIYDYYYEEAIAQAERELAEEKKQ